MTKHIGQSRKQEEKQPGGDLYKRMGMDAQKPARVWSMDECCISALTRDEPGADLGHLVALLLMHAAGLLGNVEDGQHEEAIGDHLVDHHDRDAEQLKIGGRGGAVSFKTPAALRGGGYYWGDGVFFSAPP